MDTITQNIVIWSTPRVGSTALGQWLRARFDLKQHTTFNEPQWNGKMVHLDAYHDRGLPWIVKLHLAQRRDYPLEWQELFDSPATLKVRIQRRDHVSQIASFYIAMMRHDTTGDSWQFTKGQESRWDRGDTVAINPVQLLIARDVVMQQRLRLSQWDQQWWQDLYYEDLALQRTDHRPTPQPSNYREVLEAVDASMRDFEEITEATKILTPRITL
jgi:hypothetical protein